MGGSEDCDALLGDCRGSRTNWGISRCGFRDCVGEHSAAASEASRSGALYSVRDCIGEHSTASAGALLALRTLSTARSGAPSSLYSIPANAMLML